MSERVYRYRIDFEGRVLHDGTEVDDPGVLRQLLARVERDAAGRPFSRCMGEINRLEADDVLYVIRDFAEPAAGAAELAVTCQGGLRRRLDLGSLHLRERTYLYGELAGGHRARFDRQASRRFAERHVVEHDGGFALRTPDGGLVPIALEAPPAPRGDARGGSAGA